MVGNDPLKPSPAKKFGGQSNLGLGIDKSSLQTGQQHMRDIHCKNLTKKSN